MRRGAVAAVNNDARIFRSRRKIAVVDERWIRSIIALPVIFRIDQLWTDVTAGQSETELVLGYDRMLDRVIS